LTYEEVDDMKNELKKKILELRNLGNGYKAIAKELSITPSAVRSVCTAKFSDPDLYGTCKNCGNRVKQTPGKKKRQFCSDKCRMGWWNSHRDEVARKSFYTYTCPICNSEFEAYGNSKRIYCSISCYVKSRAKRGNEQ